MEKKQNCTKYSCAYTVHFSLQYILRVAHTSARAVKAPLQMKAIHSPNRPLVPSALIKNGAQSIGNSVS